MKLPVVKRSFFLFFFCFFPLLGSPVAPDKGTSKRLVGTSFVSQPHRSQHMQRPSWQLQLTELPSVYNRYEHKSPTQPLFGFSRNAFPNSPSSPSNAPSYPHTRSPTFRTVACEGRNKDYSMTRKDRVGCSVNQCGQYTSNLHVDVACFPSFLLILNGYQSFGPLAI